MTCGACAERARRAAAEARKNAANVTPTFVPSTETTLKKTVALPLAEKSETDALVKLRYNGGGYSTHGHGCRSCGGTGTKYTFVTSETISFVSEDSADGYFKRLFTVGHDYYVTEKQAEYLLTLTFRSRAGKTVHKFERM